MVSFFDMKILHKNALLRMGAGLLLSLCYLPVATADGQFEDSEIRVIKNKYFEKSLRLELSAGLNTVMNQSFLYTYMGGLSLAFHINEQFGLQGEAGLAQTVRKGDCETLGREFRIDPVVQEMQNFFGGSLQYTPIYGKFQLTNGRVIYFDWFFEGGGGIAQIRAGGLGCAVGGTSLEDQPVEGSAIAIQGSTGQRIFVSQYMSVNWKVRLLRAERIANDGENNAESSGIADGDDYIMLNLGVSYFL